MTSRMEKVDFMENRFLLEIYRMDERFERATPLENPRCSSVYTDGWIGKCVELEKNTLLVRPELKQPVDALSLHHLFLKQGMSVSGREMRLTYILTVAVCRYS